MTIPAFEQAPYASDPALFAKMTWAATEREERRTRLLSYIQDMRDMLALWGSCVPGERPQAYRDRWSALCRQLCEDGKPVLNLVSG